MGKSKPKDVSQESHFADAKEDKQYEAHKKHCSESNNEDGKTPFLITIHRVGQDKQNGLKLISEELNELEMSAGMLDRQLKEFIGMGIVLYNMQYLLYQTAELINSLLRVESKVSSKKQISKCVMQYSIKRYIHKWP